MEQPNCSDLMEQLSEYLDWIDQQIEADEDFRLDGHGDIHQHRQEVENAVSVLSFLV